MARGVILAIFLDMINVLRKTSFMVTGLALGFLVSCGGLSATSGSSSTSSGSSDSGSTQPAVGGNVSSVAITDNAGTVDLSGIGSDESAVLLVYSFNESSTSESFSVSSSLSSSLNPIQMAVSDEVAEESGNLTEDFHLQLREWEQDLAETEDDMADPAADLSFSTSYATVGDTQTFKVLNSFTDSSSYDTVTATLRVQTEYFNFYVDNRNLNDVDLSSLSDLSDTFAGAIPTQNALIGSESDIDGNGRFNVLFTQTVNELGATGGGIVTGFFYAIDLFNSSTYEISNEQEIFYTFVPDSSGSYGPSVTSSFAFTNIYPGVLTHEYQHMISFNQHYNVNSGSVESGWLNEGLSHLFEDIYSANSSNYFVSTGLENPSRVSSYLSNISNTCFTCGTSLTQRGGSYLFVRYLYEQAELGNLSNVTTGAALLDALLDTSLTGVDNVINAAYGSSGTDDDFKNLLGLFGLAVYLDGTGLNTDDRLSISGIDLRGDQDDNRGTSLSGPAVQTVSSFPFSDSLTGMGLSFVQISGSTASSVGGSLSLSSESGSDFGAYLIEN